MLKFSPIIPFFNSLSFILLFLFFLPIIPITIPYQVQFKNSMFVYTVTKLGQLGKRSSIVRGWRACICAYGKRIVALKLAICSLGVVSGLSSLRGCTRG